MSIFILLESVLLLFWLCVRRLRALLFRLFLLILQDSFGAAAGHIISVYRVLETWNLLQMFGQAHHSSIPRCGRYY